jgi:hypothetical protein
MKYVITKQHYDMVPGTVVYSVPNMGPELFTVREGVYQEPWLRLVPAEKVEKVDE